MTYAAFGDGYGYGDGQGKEQNEPGGNSGFFEKWWHFYLLNQLNDGYGRTTYDHLLNNECELVSLTSTRAVEGHLINRYVRSL